MIKIDNMDYDDPDDDGTSIAELLERAEKSLRDNGGNKYYVTQDELFLLVSQEDFDREHRVEKDCGGNWVIEAYYSRMIFIHATSFNNFVMKEPVNPILQ